MTVTRRLEDLFKLGTKAVFGDGNGDPVEVYLLKTSPVDKESCFRRANAAKALYLRASDEEDGEEWLSVYASVREFGDAQELLPLILSDDMRRARNRIEAELAAEEEWSEHDYLQGLRDRWLGDAENKGLRLRYVEEPDDPEVAKLFAELKRFDDEANDRFEADKVVLRDAWLEASKEEIWRAATREMIKTKASELYAAEYEYQQVYYSTFELVTVVDPENGEEMHGAGKRYYSTVDAVKNIDEKIRVQLVAQIDQLEVGAMEGKDWPEQPVSSDSSASPEILETSPPSGPPE